MSVRPILTRESALYYNDKTRRGVLSLNKPGCLKVIKTREQQSREPKDIKKRNMKKEKSFIIIRISKIVTVSNTFIF